MFENSLVFRHRINNWHMSKHVAPQQTCNITEHALLNKLTSCDLIRQPCFQTDGIYMYILAGINISVFEKVLLLKMMITYIPSCTKKNSSFVQYVNKVCFFKKNMKRKGSRMSRLVRTEVSTWDNSYL